MAQMREIKRRIRSIKSTQQITKAMKMVAAAKLRRSQERMMGMRPYADKLTSLLSIVLPEINPSEHPLLTQNPVKNIAVILLTSDKGLCGSFNTNIISYAHKFLEQKKTEGVNCELITIGHKGYLYFSKRPWKIIKNYRDFYKDLSYIQVTGMMDPVVDGFLRHDFDEIYLVYNEFINVMSQRIVAHRLVPLKLEDVISIVGPSKYADDYYSEVDLVDQKRHGEQFLIEPDVMEVTTTLFKKYLATDLFHALLESIAAEFGARMSAMDNATKSAKDMIDRLTLVYNKARQAAITKEISEIVGGANALSE